MEVLRIQSIMDFFLGNKRNEGEEFWINEDEEHHMHLYDHMM